MTDNLDPSPAPLGPRLPLALPILILAAVLPYLNSLHGEFHFDDGSVIVENPHIRSFDQVPQWRPLSRFLPTLANAIQYRLFGPPPGTEQLDNNGTLYNLPPWHALNIALHAACTLALFWMLRLLLTKPQTLTVRTPQQSIANRPSSSIRNPKSAIRNFMAAPRGPASVSSLSWVPSSSPSTRWPPSP